MTYEQYRRWIIMGYPDVGRGPVIDLVAGSFSGGTAVLFTYPLDLVRTKLAYQIAGSSKMNFQGLASAHVYRGIRHCFWMTYKESGIRGLYRGAAPSLYGIFPYAGLKFYFYEEMKRHVPKEHKNDIPVKLVERLSASDIAELKRTWETLEIKVTVHVYVQGDFQQGCSLSLFARLLLFGCKWHLARDLLVDSDQLSLGESLVERNRVQKYANLSENLLSSEVSERSEKQSYKAQASDKCERSFGRKRGCGPSIGASISDNIETSQPTPHCYDHDDEENTDPSARVGDDHLDMVDVLESVEGTVTTLGKSVDTKFHKLDNHLKTQSSSFNSIEDYNGMLCGGETLTGPTEPRLVEGQEMYCSDEVGNDVIGKNERMGTESDIDIRQGNSFAVVDPIPIPGPPGSFLPSPRDMGSDDFQGNSSLTTSRVQSSQDQLDLVDGDSSDSPISATSTISNSTAARSNLKYSESLSSVGAHEVQDKRRSFFFSASIEASVKNADVVPQTTGTGAEKSCIDGEKFKANKIYIEKRPPSFKNDGQPCCCQRKEHISQDIAPDFQESQLLKRWTMASMKLPAMGKQIGCSPNARPNNLDARILGMFSWWFFLYLSSVWFRLKRCNLFSVSRYQLVMLWPP